MFKLWLLKDLVARTGDKPTLKLYENYAVAVTKRIQSVCKRFGSAFSVYHFLFGATSWVRKKCAHRVGSRSLLLVGDILRIDINSCWLNKGRVSCVSGIEEKLSVRLAAVVCPLCNVNKLSLRGSCTTCRCNSGVILPLAGTCVVFAYSHCPFINAEHFSHLAADLHTWPRLA